MQDTVISLVSDELSADVALHGAELVRLDDAVGNALLWDGDPAFWAGRAPLLFPIVGTLRGGTFRHRGATHALPRHGFARRSTFAVVDRGTGHVTLRLEDDAASRAVWPFAFRLDVTHALAGRTATTTVRLDNRSDEAMPASFGFHPGFRWPLPGAGPRAAHAIRFAEAEPDAVRRLDGDGLLDSRPRPSPVVGDRLALDDSLFAEDVLFFDRLRSRRLVYGTDAVRLIVDFPDMPHLGLWTKPGAGFLCIEPWAGHADPADASGALVDKPGTRMVPPGATTVYSMAVTLDFGG